MSLNIKKEVAWLQEHATQAEDGVWKCNISDTPIMEKEVYRSTGWGDAVPVGHLHCLTCEPMKPFPRNGEPIDESELIEFKDEPVTES